jgi:hypothetical protein
MLITKLFCEHGQGRVTKELKVDVPHPNNNQGIILINLH